MKWVDYREKLGIGFNDEQKFQMLKNKCKVYLSEFSDDELFDVDDLKQYLMCVGENRGYYSHPSEGLVNSIDETQTCVELISKMIAFCNTYSPHQKTYQYPIKVVKSKDIFIFLQGTLQTLNISFELIKDSDGYLSFPKALKNLTRLLFRSRWNG